MRSVLTPSRRSPLGSPLAAQGIGSLPHQSSRGTLLGLVRLLIAIVAVPLPNLYSQTKGEGAVLWIAYMFFGLAALSCALTTVAFVGICANRGVSRSIFNASAINTVFYTALGLATRHLVG